MRSLWDELIYLEYVHRVSALRSTRYAGKHGLRLNLGSGHNLKSGWVNVDLYEKAQLHLDLRRKLPFEDGSVARIYSEHLFEHLVYPSEAKTLLEESYRVLAAGGLFQVGVPDAEWPVRAYVTGEREYFELAHRYGWHPDWCDTAMHHVNFNFRGRGEHKYAYDFETMAKILAQAGFVSIERREFDPEIDSERRRVGTLYVNGTKPLRGAG